MMRTYEGVVKGNTIVLDSNVRLPEGARVEVHVADASANRSGDGPEDPFEALLQRRAGYEGRGINVEEIIEEEKQDREERFDHWLFPER